jgi:chemotaxis protein methyltransferase CheR
VTVTIDSREVERFREAIARQFGLQFEDAKLGFLADVLRRRLDVCGQRPDDYLRTLLAGGSPDELKRLTPELTVGETYFFRHVEQYRAFIDITLPARLASAHASGRPLAILSAGCSSGEEPYSLAIAVRNAGVNKTTNVNIRGVDLNGTVIEKARRGRFSPWVMRDTPPDLQRRWFRVEGRDFILDESVRDAVRFEVCNLAAEHSDVWQPETQDIIFCRNVLMYFTPATAHAVVGRLARTLRPGGYLFLGHAETLRGLSSDFHLHHTHGTFYYQRRDRIATDTSHVVAPPSALAFNAAVPEPDHFDTTWIETIRRASERIEVLVDRSGQASSAVARAARKPPPAWEIGLALELLREERFTEALALMDAYPAESGRDTQVLLLRAVLLTHSGQFAAAEAACERLLAVDELNAGAHYLLALCREGVGDPGGAMHHDQVAVYLDPAFAMAHLHLGVLGRRTADRATAHREFEQAIVLLQREDASRLLLFGGGFSREALVALCRAELLGSGGRP